MIDILKDTLSKVNDWIKYAEAKNAANIAFCSASIFGLLRLVSGTELMKGYLSYYLLFMVICLVISLAISLLSFVPRLRVPWIHIGERDESDNLLYFGHACKYSASKYMSKLYGGKEVKSTNFDLESMYANQIVVNSKVAFVKFKQFDLAVWFTLTAILSPLGALIASKVRT
ncbi:Pycsar system effector family protein [Pseudoalteromonas sp. SS15]|uniref:Pycsar system effector family protein n=1 Tax=Pseudoalteromonas sp. SS15 TaxID=3139393 RepID=UPI003BA96CCC